MSDPQVPPIPEHAFVSFCAEITPKIAEEFLGLCCQLVNGGTKSIYFLFSSTGGSIPHGVHIYNVLRALPAKIIMHNVGAVYSVSNVIFLAGEERYATPEATFMFHGASVQSQLTSLDQRAADAFVDELQASQRKMAHIIGDRAGFPSEQSIVELFKDTSTRDVTWAKDHDLIHEVRPAKLPQGCSVFQSTFMR